MRLPFPAFSTSARSQQHIGEVIETATTEYLAQCLEPEDLSFPVMPAFEVGLNLGMRSREIRFMG